MQLGRGLHMGKLHIASVEHDRGSRSRAVPHGSRQQPDQHKQQAALVVSHQALSTSRCQYIQANTMPALLIYAGTRTFWKQEAASSAETPGCPSGRPSGTVHVSTLPAASPTVSTSGFSGAPGASGGPSGATWMQVRAARTPFAPGAPRRVHSSRPGTGASAKTRSRPSAAQQQTK